MNGNMIKKMFCLMVLCLSLLVCDSQLPTSPDISIVGIPVIVYFNASDSYVVRGECSTLSWKTTVTGCVPLSSLRVFLFCGDDVHEFNPGVASVDREGAMEVYPVGETIYTLVARVGDESISSLITIQMRR